MLKYGCVSLSSSDVPSYVVFHGVQMCTKLYDKDEFQPLDPSQEPIFPPELIVSCYAFPVSQYGVARASLYHTIEPL